MTRTAMTVPGTRYQSDSTAATSPSGHAQRAPVASPRATASQSSPRRTKASFMAQDSGSTPTAETTRAHGPSWPACSPVLGVM
jgi:hypothetical protein